MPSRELAPSRGWRSIVTGPHVLGDRPGINLKSQSCEFGLDSFLTPEPVLSSHLSDESLRVLGNRPSTNPPALAVWAPGPVGTPTPSMPPQHRFGLHNKERIAPTVEHRLAQIQNCRSGLRKRGCGCLAAAPMNCCRRHRFSVTSRAFGLRAAEMIQTRKQTTPPLRLIPSCRRGAKPRDCQTAKPTDGHFAPYTPVFSHGQTRRRHSAAIILCAPRFVGEMK
jgi:hypothetical protein